MKIKELTLLMIFVITYGNVYSQHLNLDSLKKVWSNETLADSTRLDALYNIVKVGHESGQPDSASHHAQLYYDFAEKRNLKKQMSRILNRQGIYGSNTGDYEGAIEYYNRSLKIAEEIGYKKGVASSLNNIGRVHEKLGNYVKAKDYFLRCVNLFKEIGNQRGSLITMNNIATIYLHQGDYKAAIDFYTSSLKIAEQIEAKDIILNLLNNIGLVYKRQNDYSKAIEYYTLSLETAREINNKTGMALTLNNIGSIYETLGDNASAIDYYNQSLKISEEIRDQERMVSCLINIGSIYKNLKNYSKAIDYQIRGLKIAKKIGYKRGIAFSSRNIGLTYYVQGDAVKSITYSLSALSTAKELGLVEEIKFSADNLYKAYELTGNYRVSLKMYKLYINMRDSIENIEVQKELISQEYKYNYEKQAVADSIAFVKKRELDVFNNQTKLDKERYALLGGFSLLLIFIGVYLRIRFIKGQAEKEALLQKIEMLKVEANINLTTSIAQNKHPQLDKKRIETAINSSLNKSDWNILNALYNNPAIGNKEIADAVSLSVEGVRSSLKKMYSFFYIEKTANQRVVLVIEAAKLSKLSLNLK